MALIIFWGKNSGIKTDKIRDILEMERILNSIKRFLEIEQRRQFRGFSVRPK
jgi:hypothetical protein